MKNTLMTAAAIMTLATGASALTASHTQACGPGDGLGPDLVCSVYVQGEVYGKAAFIAGYEEADMRTAPEVRQSDLIGDTFISDDGVIVIGVDGTQNDLYNLYLRWMADNGFVTNDEVANMIALKSTFVAPPLGFDFDGSILGAGQ